MYKLLEQIQKGENQITEFKTSFQKEVIESIVAFANAQGGKVFIGINGVKQHILKLKKENRLIRHGDNRNGYWKVTK